MTSTLFSTGLNGIVEADENNNRASIRVMTDMVDISLSATDLIFTPAHPVMASPGRAHMTAHNTGIVAHRGLQPCALRRRPGSQTACCSRPSRLANITGDGSATVTYIFTAEPKTYRFYAVADTENVVTEMYEGNNPAIRSLKIKAPGEVLGPDLVPVKIDLTDTTTDPQTLAISGTAHGHVPEQGRRQDHDAL